MVVSKSHSTYESLYLMVWHYCKVSVNLHSYVWRLCQSFPWLITSLQSFLQWSANYIWQDNMAMPLKSFMTTKCTAGSVSFSSHIRDNSRIRNVTLKTLAFKQTGQSRISSIQYLTHKVADTFRKQQQCEVGTQETIVATTLHQLDHLGSSQEVA